MRSHLQPGILAFALVGCCIAPRIAQAQDAATFQQQYEQWVSLDLDYSPTKKLSLGAQYVCRTYGFLDYFKGSYYYVQGRYSITKHIQGDMQARVVDNHERNLYRLEVGARYRLKWRKTLLYFRTGYFNEREHLDPDNKLQHSPDNYWRNRIRYRRTLSKAMSGYVSAEAYSRFDAQGLVLKRLAFIGGLSYRLARNRSVFAEYLYQPEYAVKLPVQLQSVTFGFEWDLTKPRYHRRGSDRKESDE